MLASILFIVLVLFYVFIYSTLENRDFPLNKNTLHLNFPGKARYHISRFRCSDYATNGLQYALLSPSSDISGWFYSHSTKLTPHKSQQEFPVGRASEPHDVT